MAVDRKARVREMRTEGGLSQVMEVSDTCELR